MNQLSIYDYVDDYREHNGRLQRRIPHGPKHIRARLYMQANGLQDGDYHDITGYQIWLSKRLNEFKEMHSIHPHDTLGQLQDEFTEYLRGFIYENHSQRTTTAIPISHEK